MKFEQVAKRLSSLDIDEREYVLTERRFEFGNAFRLAQLGHAIHLRRIEKAGYRPAFAASRPMPQADRGQLAVML
jgi:hypothetical protein